MRMWAWITAGVAALGALVGIGYYEEKKHASSSNPGGSRNPGGSPTVQRTLSLSLDPSQTYSTPAERGSILWIRLPDKIDTFTSAFHADPGVISAEVSGLGRIGRGPNERGFWLAGGKGKIALTWLDNVQSPSVQHNTAIEVA